MAQPARHSGSAPVQRPAIATATPTSVRAYLSAEQLAAVTPWSVNAIRKMVARGTFRRGVHYFQPLGGRRQLVFKWAAIVDFIEAQAIRCVGPLMVDTADGAQVPGPQKGIDVEKATTDFERLLG